MKGSFIFVGLGVKTDYLLLYSHKYVSIRVYNVVVVFLLSLVFAFSEELMRHLALQTLRVLGKSAVCTLNSIVRFKSQCYL